MVQTFNVTLGDGEILQVRTTAGDLARLYTWCGGEVKGDNPNEHAYLFWLAAKRTGKFADDFEAFLDVLEDYESVELPKAVSKKQSPSSSR